MSLPEALWLCGLVPVAMATIRLHLASGNAHKVAEFQDLARTSGLALDIVSARAVGGMPEVEEDAGTFVGNARKKARALRARVPAGGWVMADDSGLCVDALGGAPGAANSSQLLDRAPGAATPCAASVSSAKGLGRPVGREPAE